MTLSAQDRSALIRLARSAVAAAIQGRPMPKAEDLQGVLTEMRGCFVTLTNAGRLRGCIGTFNPTAPLGEMIVTMAASAACNDPRFFADRITPEELPEVTVEVSVLSPLTETDDPASLRIGTDGVYIVHGQQSGCFLPEVATDMNWDAETFLTECCTGKAGMSPDAWKQPDTTVYLFTSEKFAE
ncbi:MAG: AmmeMemoRadiSam system protein A [Planctomycetota bacterium]|jgi:AmmeMemoRadiSam system protein A